MENKLKDNSNEAPLLLKYPVNMFSLHSGNENILMPVGVQIPRDNLATPSSNICDSTRNMEFNETSSVCQLQQPLLFGGISKTNKSDISLPVDDTNSVTAAFGNFNVANNAQTSETCPVFHESSLYHFSHSSQCDNSSLYKFESGTSNDSKAILETLSTHSTESLLHDSDPKSGFFMKSLSNHDYKEGNTLSEDSSLHSTTRRFHPVKPYWLFQDVVESKEIWYGFSERDSERLENSYQQGLEFEIPTDGGRYDVFLKERVKKSAYFDAKDLHVRRCTWFYQYGSSLRFKPYDENTADCLEAYYRDWITSGAQESRFAIPGLIGNFLFEKPVVMLHYGIDVNTWTTPNDPKGSPKIVKRGLPDGFQIMPNESPKIDNLLFIVQGIGSFCDLRFRTVFECVDGFRDISNKLIESHFRKEVEQGFVGRVEILPVAWHAKLRTSDIGLDRTMKIITLPSIPKLRHFTNDTLIDILLYSSPSYCQSIINTVAEELNKLYDTFLSRNPEFCGKVFVGGHSLGSLILFDILSNQSIENNNAEKEEPSNEENLTYILEHFKNVEELLKAFGLEEYVENFENEKIDLSSLPYLTEEDLVNLGLPLGHRRKLISLVFSKEKMASTIPNKSSESSLHNQCVFDSNIIQDDYLANNKRMIFPLQKSNSGRSSIVYPRLSFHPAAFFAMGSPISMFLAIRGYDSISEKYSFPTCPAFFHIFHPYDPVAFRIEPMIDQKCEKKPALIPHHKGRKRMHLEIKENVAKFASEVRQKIVDTFHKTWNSFYEITGLHPFPAAVMEQEVNSIMPQDIPEITTYEDLSPIEIPIGNLNGGRRIDYVLQEKPLEALNDYVWALTSHATYWDSEDTVLMILKEIYAIQGINISLLTDSETFSESPLLSNDSFSLHKECVDSIVFPNLQRETILPTSATISNDIKSTPTILGATIPGSQHIGPPPLSGFVKRSAFK